MKLEITDKDLKKARPKDPVGIKKAATEKEITKEKYLKFAGMVRMPDDLGRWGELAEVCDVTPEQVEEMYFDLKNRLKLQRIAETKLT